MSGKYVVHVSIWDKYLYQLKILWFGQYLMSPSEKNNINIK